MIKDIFKCVNLGLLGPVVGMVLIGGPSNAAQPAPGQKKPEAS